MKIVHSFHHYLPFLGGIERVIQELAERQADQGDEVHILTSVYGSKGRAKEEKINGVNVHRLKAVRFYYNDLTLPLEFPEKVLENADILHVHNPKSLFNTVLTRKASSLDCRTVVEFLAIGYLENHENIMVRTLGRPYQAKVEEKAVNLADKIIVLNERDYRLLKDIYIVEPEIVPHGVEKRYLTAPQSRKFRDSYGLHEKVLMGYVGRLHPSKGVDLILKAIPKINRDLSNFKFVIAGKGKDSYRKKLEKLAARLGVTDFVEFTGYISEEEKISLLDCIEAFVFPTRHHGEAYPLVIDEAYSRETPVIGSNVGSLPYRIEDTKTGTLVPPDDPPALAEAIEYFLDREDGKEGIEYELERAKESVLSWADVRERFDKIYHGLIE